MTAIPAHDGVVAIGAVGPCSAAWAWRDGGPQRPAAARAAVGDTLARWGLSAVAADVMLMVSELVTNACVHGVPPVTVHVEVRPGPPGAELACEVTDTDPGMPAPAAAVPGAEHGRGLAVVAALAGACGASPGPVGKTVWFRLAIPAPAGRAGVAREGRAA